MQGFYARLRDKRHDDDLLQDCIETVVNRLMESETSADRPGMLLGKIQSGKTRGFLGIITRAFDRDFDIALVFTKGTRTLARQTVRRISSDFKEFIDDEQMSVYDIMEMPEKMMRSELRRKIVIVAKKEANNLSRVIELFQETHPELAKKRVLLVDDEADMASVRFVRSKETDDYAQGSIAQQMDDLRRLVPSIAFLQVTATPYALYLQPEEYQPQADQFVFFPKRPAFTELLPIHGGYVGGDDYFGDFGTDDPRSYLFVPVPPEEQDALRVPDGRVIREDRLWTSSKIVVLRQALMTFFLAVVIRRWQQKQQELRPGKYVMVMHNDTQRHAHQWQADTVAKLLAAFEEAADGDDKPLKALFNTAYEDLFNSVSAHGGRVLSQAEAYKAVKELILDGEIHVQRVNSDVQLAPLLDPDTAELKLRTHANIFIGGSILDRGITIPSLISFYYGRNPKRMQADTVLQHSRMYGNRDRADLAVTRFYTSTMVHSRLEQIHKLESALREAFESGIHDRGVVFIQNDAKKGIVPCSPSKIAVSDVTTIKKDGFYLPAGFNTYAGKVAKKAYEDIAAELAKHSPDTKTFSEVSLEEAIRLLERTKHMIDIANDADFDWNAMTGLLTYYSKVTDSEKVLLVVETNRELDRGNSGDKSGRSIIGTAVRRLLETTHREYPTLIMLGQKGSKKLSWAGDMPFWWPVLAVPSNAEPCVFANAVAK